MATEVIPLCSFFFGDCDRAVPIGITRLFLVFEPLEIPLDGLFEDQNVGVAPVATLD